MAYGLVIRNKNNQIVLSDETVAIQQIRSGVMQHVGNIGSPPSMSDSRVFELPGGKTRNSLIFMQPKAGQYVTSPRKFPWSGTFPEWGVLSNWTDPIPFFECAPAYEITRPKPGWGLEIRAPDGSLRFHSGAELVAFDGFYAREDLRSVDTGYYGKGWSHTVNVGNSAWICPRGGGGTFQELISNYPPSRRNVSISWAVARLTATQCGITRVVSRPATTSESNAISHVITGMSLLTAE